MKTDTHPEYSDVSVKCSCGNAFTTRSTCLLYTSDAADE